MDVLPQDTNSQGRSLIPMAGTPLALTTCGSQVKLESLCSSMKANRIKVSLYYISTEKLVAQISMFVNYHGSNSTPQSFLVTVPSDLSPTGASLSVSSTSSPANSTCDALLFFENQLGNITVMHTFQDPISLSSHDWIDVSEELRDSFQNVSDASTNFGSPFTTAYFPLPLLDLSSLWLEYVCLGLFFPTPGYSKDELLLTIYSPTNQTFRTSTLYFACRSYS